MNRKERRAQAARDRKAPFDVKAEVIGANHPISILANVLSAHAYQLAAVQGISRWEVAVAMANACGHILADSGDIPRDQALHRMDMLRQAIEGGFDLRDVEGSS